MKRYFIAYKPFLLFLGTFFLVYAVLMFLYQGYLSSFGENKFDSITVLVAHNAEQVLQLFDAKAKLIWENGSLVLKFGLQQKHAVRIIEGCNAISVIILFVSFVVSFSAKLKPTLLFVLSGSLFIYILNVFRIAFLCVLLNRFPEQEHFMHGVLFPLLIYGTVFILWIVWVNRFSKYAK